MTNKRISIVLPTHHRPHLLAKTIESLFQQTYPHELLEILVVPSENDAAFEYLRKLGPTPIPVRTVVMNDPLGGRNAAGKRNLAVKQAAGEWVALIDDDCVAHPDWIRKASERFDDPKVGAVEGEKQIPEISPPTLTYKGLKMLTYPKGYQTCNLFYRRDIFLKLGGFDENFPFYLEDSDLAWSVLDAGYEIPYQSGAIVYHPVNEPAPWRMLADARRAVLMPRLFQKHPEQFRLARMKVLRWSHWIYIAMYLGALTCGILGYALPALAILGAILMLLMLHVFKLFRGCRVQTREFMVTTLLLPVVPVVKFVQLVRGNLKYGVWLWT